MPNKRTNVRNNTTNPSYNFKYMGSAMTYSVLSAKTHKYFLYRLKPIYSLLATEITVIVSCYNLMQYSILLSNDTIYLFLSIFYHTGNIILLSKSMYISSNRYVTF